MPHNGGSLLYNGGLLLYSGECLPESLKPPAKPQKGLKSHMALCVLMGTYEHSVDAKGRMSFPTRLREALGESFIVTRGKDACLCVYSQREWQALTEKINALSVGRGAVQRRLFSAAAEVEPDKQGRILIPQILREYAGLKKDVVVIGASNRAEIWDQARWQALSEEELPEDVENILDELGL